MQLEIVMAFGFESIGSFPVKTWTFFTGTSIFPCLFHFPACLVVIFQIPNANPFGILLATSVSPEITMGLGLFCYSLHNLPKLWFLYL